LEIPINCESNIGLQENLKVNGIGIQVVTKDVVRHEGNMNGSMENEVLVEAAVLIVKANYTINTTLANNLQQHMSQIFNGTWTVLVSDGQVYSSVNTSKDREKYIRFSYKNYMFLVTQKVRKHVLIIL